MKLEPDYNTNMMIKDESCNYKLSNDDYLMRSCNGKDYETILSIDENGIESEDYKYLMTIYFSLIIMKYDSWKGMLTILNKVINESSVDDTPVYNWYDKYENIRDLYESER